MTTAYSRQQFCVGAGDELNLKLRAHPDLPHLLLTISNGPEADFTLSAETWRLRAIIREIAALFEGPALKPNEERAAIFVTSGPLADVDVPERELDLDGIAR